MTNPERPRPPMPSSESPLTGKLFEGLSKATRLAKELGPKATAAHGMRRLLSAIRGPQSFQIFLIVLSEPRPGLHAAAARDHTFRFASLAELEALSKDPTAGVHPWDLEAATGGSRCLLQLDGKRLVGYSWVATGPLIELTWGVHFNMPDDMVYNYNGFTAPRYRGTAYQGLRHLKLLEAMRSEGKRRLFAYVDDLNSRSLRGVEKSGYRRVGMLTGVKRAGKTRFSLSIDTGAWSEIVRSGPSQHHQAAPVASKIVQ